MSSCITTTTVIKNCDNPIERLLNPILTGGIDSFERILDKGMITPYCGCCPCPEDDYGLYFLGSAEEFGQFYEGLSMQNGENISCCSTFNEAVNEMKCFLRDRNFAVGGSSYTSEFDYLLSQGIIEYGLINGQSQLMVIINWYKSNYSILSKKKINLIDILDLIFGYQSKGIVITCNGFNAGTSISSVETFFKLAESVGPSDTEMNTCCINILAEPRLATIIKNGINESGSQPVPG